jgi:hypothetical protein
MPSHFLARLVSLTVSLGAIVQISIFRDLEPADRREKKNNDIISKTLLGHEFGVATSLLLRGLVHSLGLNCLSAIFNTSTRAFKHTSTSDSL